MRFSERTGLAPVSTTIQTRAMSPALRNSIWNVLDEVVFSRPGFVSPPRGDVARIMSFSRMLWSEHFKLPADTRKQHGFEILGVIRVHFFTVTWAAVYDFVEFVVEHQDGQNPQVGLALRRELNRILERELAGYRLVGSQIVEITDPAEVQLLQEVLSDDRFVGVNAHLRRSMELLSDRTNPDFRNSIKESISAVESLAQLITGKPKATLGDALKALKRGADLHPALSDGFSKLYGYTSDEDGVRHAMLEEPTLTLADAKYFLLSCTSFINYLKALM
jgi:hypothetical protein